MVQALNEITLSRPWHWGIAVVGDPLASVPDLEPERVAAVSSGSIVVRVHHAQDIDAEVFEGDWDWAVARFHIRTLVEAEDALRTILCDAVLETPNHEVAIGDADGFLRFPGHGSRTRVVVSAVEADLTGLDEVWIDLLPVDESATPEVSVGESARRRFGRKR